MKELDGRLAQVKAEYDLPPDSPGVLLIDNVSSHINKEVLRSIKSPTGFTIYHVVGTHVYLLMGLPNRSHCLNSGDQMVNKTLRDTCRQKAKLRLLKHCLKIADGMLTPGTPLDMTEVTCRC